YSPGNEIDGESLLLLNNTEVASMGFKIGTAAKFRKLLEILRSEVSAQKGVNLQNEIETVGLSLRSEFQSTSDFAKEQESTETVELNLFEILKSEKKGKEIVANYISRNKDFITHEERIEVVNIICSHMIAVNPLKHFPSTTFSFFFRMNSLILCLQLLPAVFNVKKASFDSKVDRHFHFVLQNALISEAVEAKDVIHHKQPYLIVVGSLEHPLSFNLVVDQTLIPLVRDCSRSFYVLFASFFVFRLESPAHLDKFYLFFEQFVFQIYLGELCYKISPSNQEFANMLDNIALKNIYGEADAAQKLLSPFKNPTSSFSIFRNIVRTPARVKTLIRIKLTAFSLSVYNLVFLPK
ncbi:Uncharacterized protein APZ42_002045, partial [Daphnia magna]